MTIGGNHQKDDISPNPKSCPWSNWGLSDQVITKVRSGVTGLVPSKNHGCNLLARTRKKAWFRKLPAQESRTFGSTPRWLEDPNGGFTRLRLLAGWMPQSGGPPAGLRETLGKRSFSFGQHPDGFWRFVHVRTCSEQWPAVACPHRYI